MCPCHRARLSKWTFKEQGPQPSVEIITAAVPATFSTVELLDTKKESNEAVDLTSKSPTVVASSAIVT